MASNHAKLAAVCFAVMLAGACSPTPEQARAKIDARELTFDELGIGHAIMSNDTKLLRLFITAGYDLNAFEDVSDSALMLATRLSHETTLKLLTEAGARAEQLPGVLNLPARRGDLKTMRLLLDAGADINSRDTASQTALLSALEFNQVESVRFLLENGANPDGVGKHAGRLPVSPLILAIESGLLEAAELLVEAGADPRARTGGIDAIEAAERAGFEDLARRIREVWPG